MRQEALPGSGGWRAVGARGRPLGLGKGSGSGPGPAGSGVTGTSGLSSRSPRRNRPTSGTNSCIRAVHKGCLEEVFCSSLPLSCFLLNVSVLKRRGVVKCFSCCSLIFFQLMSSITSNVSMALDFFNCVTLCSFDVHSSKYSISISN